MLNSDNLLSFITLIISAYIPFAIFLIEGNDKTDDEKDFFKVERAVILKYVMHVPLLIITLLMGGISAILFFDDTSCKPEYVGCNILLGVVFLISTSILIYIMIEVVRWISSSSRPDDVNSFHFKKWKKYLSNLHNNDFNETWSKIFGNKKLPSILQPAYISIFLCEVAKQDRAKKYRSLSILSTNITNINLERPDVLTAIIETLPIDDDSIFLYDALCDAINGPTLALLFHLINKDVKDNQNKARLVANQLVFNKIEKYFSNDNKLRSLLVAIPSDWKICVLLEDNTAAMPLAMANAYIPWMTQIINKREKEVGIIAKEDRINSCIIGNFEDDVDTKFMADICEIYGEWFKMYIPDKDKFFEEALMEKYINSDARFFATSSIYSAYGTKNGKPDFEPSIKHKEKGTIYLIKILFPQLMRNEEHLARMKKIINARIKKEPANYRLQKMLSIYKKITNYTKDK